MRWTINFALLAEKKKTGIYSRRRKNEKTVRFLLDNFFLFSIFVIFLFYFFRGELGQLTRTVSQSFSSI
jgi:hypothetical protein